MKGVKAVISEHAKVYFWQRRRSALGIKVLGYYFKVQNFESL